MDCLLWTQSGSWKPYLDTRYNSLNQGMIMQSFLLVFQNYYMAYILKLMEKTGFQWLTGWEVCCLRCLENNIWEREHAAGTSSFAGFRCWAAENLHYWLTEEGKKCFVLPPIQREEMQDLGEDWSLFVGLDQELCITVWDVSCVRADGTWKNSRITALEAKIG